jgi:hypothetical protein
MLRRILVLCVTIVLAGMVACNSADGEPKESSLLEPFAYTTPIPAETPTELDGAYVRETTIEQAGGPPVHCVRCAPYRLEAGDAILVLEEGRFHVSHDIASEDAQGFESVGHYVVSGDEIAFFNDPNCTRTEGKYRWDVSGEGLALILLDDPCFGGLRAEFLSAGRWAGN